MRKAHRLDWISVLQNSTGGVLIGLALTFADPLPFKTRLATVVCASLAGLLFGLFG